MRLLAAAYFVDGLGSWAYSTVLMIYVFDRTGSTAALAGLASTRWLPVVLLSSYAGVLADRYDRVRLMVASALLAAVVMFGLTWLVAADAPLPLLYVAALVGAVVTLPYLPAAGALTPEVVEEKDLAAANSLMSGLESLVVVVGPAVGALLLTVGDPVLVVLLNGLSFLLAAWLVRRTRVRSRGGAGASGERVVTQFLDGVRALASSRVAFVLVLFCALDSAIFGVSTVVYVGISEQLGTGSTGYGYLITGMALGGLLAAGLADRLSASSRLAPVILGGIAIQAAPFALTIPVHVPVVGFLLQVVSGTGMILVDVLALTALQRDMPKNVLSRVLALLFTAVYGFSMAASFLASGLLEWLGLHATLLAVGIGFPVVAALGLPPVLRADRASVERVRALQPKVGLLQALDLFAGASRLQLERIAAALEERSVDVGKVIIREGDPADALWILVDGEVEVTASQPDGSQRHLRDVGPRDYVGEIGLLRGRPRTATVTTTEPTTFWWLPGPTFLEALQDTPPSTTLMARSTRRLARSHPQLVADSA